MLILSRLTDQVIVISHPDGDIRLTVTKVQSNGQVKLGFDASPGVRIDRLEVYEQRKREGDAA